MYNPEILPPHGQVHLEMINTPTTSLTPYKHTIKQVCYYGLLEKLQKIVNLSYKGDINGINGISN